MLAYWYSEGGTRLRVIAGSARGRPLRAPAGPGTRPTADRLKGALFSMLGERVAGASVLDLYAGSGALGIEALSRGARHAVFVDHSARAARVLRDNLARTGLSEAAAVIVADAPTALHRLSGGADRFDLVLADPPYAGGHASSLVDTLAGLADRVLAPGAVVAVEHGPGEEMPEAAGNLRRERRRVQGRGSVSLYSLAAGHAREVNA